MRACRSGSVLLCWLTLTAAGAHGAGTPEMTSATSTQHDAPAYAGSASCRDCHERFYKLWSPSHHGLAMQPFTAAFAKQQLTPQAQPLTVGPHSYQAGFDDSGGWVVERGPAGERKLPMVHVLGGKNVYYFLTPMAQGRLQTLPVAYDVRREEWFDTSASGMRHFPGGSDEPVHWTEREYTFNTSCHSCHVSQLSTNYDLASDSYNTKWAEPGINCETCHGGAAEHVRLCREAPPGQPPKDLKIIATTHFNAEQTNAMCAPCHAKMVPLTNTFLPGERYYDHFDLTTLEHPDFYPDGRDLGENYTYTSWRMSPCLKSAEFDCLHCHTSSGRFRFQDDPNQSCVPCHQERVENVAAHSHHPVDSEGNTCIGCHMPKTEFARMVRSDHSMLPPTPAVTTAFKSPNACNVCHTDKSAQWADRWVREWRSRDYQKPVLHRAGLIQAARKGDWSRLPEMLAYVTASNRDEVTAASLIRLLRPCPSEQKWSAIIQALQDASPQVRACAAEALERYFTPDSVKALLAATRDEYRVVRVRAAGSLAALRAGMLKPEDQKALASATAEFEASLNVRPDDHASHFNLGNFHSERGEFERAVASYRTAAKLQPRAVPIYVNAALAYNAMGKNDQAEASLRQALGIEPESLAANLNLGMLMGELKRMDEAAGAFRTALKADPKSPVAAYNLCVVLAEEQPSEALKWCRHAAELRPDEPKYAFTLAFYLHRGGDADGAIKALLPTLDRGSADADVYAFLGSIYEERGDTAGAVRVYRHAASNERLDPRQRHGFAERARMLSAP